MWKKLEDTDIVKDNDVVLSAEHANCDSVFKVAIKFSSMPNYGLGDGLVFFSEFWPKINGETKVKTLIDWCTTSSDHPIAGITLSVWRNSSLKLESAVNSIYYANPFDTPSLAPQPAKSKEEAPKSGWVEVTELDTPAQENDVVCRPGMSLEAVLKAGMTGIGDPSYGSEGLVIDLDCWDGGVKCAEILKVCKYETTYDIRYYRKIVKHTMNAYHSQPLPLP